MHPNLHRDYCFSSKGEGEGGFSCWSSWRGSVSPHDTWDLVNQKTLCSFEATAEAEVKAAHERALQAEDEAEVKEEGEDDHESS